MLLEPQLEGYDDIELLIFEDNRKRDYGSKLQSMIDIAQGEYVSFIDDDDLVSEHYIDTIYPLLKDDVDCVGFTGHISVNEGPTLPVFYSKENKQPRNEEYGYFRFVQHLTPIKRSIVQQVPYEGHFAADIKWTEKVIEQDLIKTENVTEEVLYFYISSTDEYREAW